MGLCLLSRDSHGDTGKLNHEETVRGPEIAISPEKSEILLLRTEGGRRLLPKIQGPLGNARSYTTHQIHLSPFRPNLPTYLPQIWSILR